jgi:hypothetical protein
MLLARDSLHPLSLLAKRGEARFHPFAITPYPHSKTVALTHLKTAVITEIDAPDTSHKVLEKLRDQREALALSHHLRGKSLLLRRE